MVETLYACWHSETLGEFPEDDPHGIYAELSGTKDYTISVRYCSECQKRAGHEGKQLMPPISDPA